MSEHPPTNPPEPEALKAVAPDAACPSRNTDGDQTPATPSFVERRRKPRPAEPTADETVKETIESIVIAFILAFIFRAFIVEPFIIPTGSMAPTMLGAHAQIACPSCGYRFDIGIDQSDLGVDALVPDPSVDCPMCNYKVVTTSGTKARSGDRILVDKFSYHFADPSRWDVVVFKAPQAQGINGIPAPRSNFIKRLVGLPGERVALLEGNVFIAPAGTNDFTIARKTDPQTNTHWQKIQRAVWQPVYHSQYVPTENAQPDGPGRDQQHAWRVPWIAQTGDWDLGTERHPSRVYRFAGGDGAIQFEWDGPYGTPSYDSQYNKYPYNQLGGISNPIEDIRLAAAFTPNTANAVLTLSTTARLDRPGSGPETLAAKLDAAGSLTLQAIAADGTARDLAYPVKIDKLKQGIATEIELWFVDDQASVWLNGQRIITAPIDLTWDQIAARRPQQPTPQVRITVESDGPVELRRVELDRDLYYAPDDRYTQDYFARAQVKRRNGTLDVGPNPLDLREQTATHDAELFCMGDNQPGSKDGRQWLGVNPWIQARYFNNEPRPGVVPRSLLVGRAFMVYYPAPHGFTPQDRGIIPDFGRVRFVH